MTLFLTSGRRMLLMITATCLLVLVILDDEAQAVPYDPFLRSGDGGGPWISDRLPMPVRRKLAAAVEMAERKIAERPSCARLFSDLGEDGSAVLGRALLYPASARMENSICQRAYAFTQVGIRPTWICRRMWPLPVWRFALILIHEALHHAGTEEWPQTRMASGSGEVTGRVVAACGF